MTGGFVVGFVVFWNISHHLVWSVWLLKWTSGEMPLLLPWFRFGRLCKIGTFNKHLVSHDDHQPSPYCTIMTSLPPVFQFALARAELCNKRQKSLLGDIIVFLKCQPEIGHSLHYLQCCFFFSGFAHESVVVTVFSSTPVCDPHAQQMSLALSEVHSRNGH